MSKLRARAAIAGLAVLTIALTTAAGFPTKTNPKDLAIAKAALLQPADVPAGFTQKTVKVEKSKPTGIKACKSTEAIAKTATAKARSEFDAEGATIDGEVDTFKTAAALSAAIDALGSPDSVACLKAGANKTLKKEKSTRNLPHTVVVTPEAISVGDRSLGYLVDLTIGPAGASQTVTVFLGVVGVGRAGNQITITTAGGPPDPALVQQTMQAATNRLTAAQQ